MKWTPETRAARIDLILGRAPVMPILVIENVEDAVPLARALCAGGLPVLEVTLRTAAALDAIRAIRCDVPEACVGAGTVLKPEDMRAVESTRAEFAIAPGATPALFEAAEVTAMPFLPGIATPAELMAAVERGYRRFKFFPAEALGGAAALRAYAGPFPTVRFCATGGIDATNAAGYFALANVATVGGSWMVPADALRARDWERITALAREAAALRPSS